MWINTALFVVGIFLCQQLSVLPNSFFVLLASIPVIGILFLVRRSRLLIPFSSFFIGFLWALLIANINLNDRLANELIKKELIISGEVIDLPTKQGRAWRFNFKLRYKRFKLFKHRLHLA